MHMKEHRAHRAMLKSSSMDACWARNAVAGKSTAGQTKTTSKTSSNPTTAAKWNFESIGSIIHRAGYPDAPLMQWICMI